MGGHDAEDAVNVEKVATSVAAQVENHALGIGVGGYDMAQTCEGYSVGEGAIVDVDDLSATKRGVSHAAGAVVADTEIAQHHGLNVDA